MFQHNKQSGTQKAPQLKISVLTGGKTMRFRWERKQRCFRLDNGDSLKEIACIKIVRVTDGRTVHNKAKRYFDEKGDGSDSSQIRILGGANEKI